jgi:drug/metabolite transporter (DMT)-like permease
MSWFLFAMIAPALYAMTNHVDKILLEKYFKEGGVGTLVLFSALMSLVALPFIFYFDSSVFNVELLNLFFLVIVGILNILVLWFYLLALRDEEASIVVVFYQLVPIIGLGLGYVMLGETISQMQAIAMAIIILGTTIISFDIDDENNFRLRKKTVSLMFAASFFWALESVLFKYVALEESVLHSLFWEHLTLGVVGILIFIFVRSYRTQFIKAIKKNKTTVLNLNFANEVIFMLGNLVSSFAYLLAPIALVLLTESFQPIFVFAIGIFLTVFFPKISVEEIHTKKVIQKILSITITGIGTYLLLIS